MKNSQLVTKYLDACAERMEMAKDLSPEGQEAYIRRIRESPEGALWDACLADGWTLAELDAAYARRFGVRVDRETGRIVRGEKQ